jgi:two-component system chemotaxis sensor kinase CheA
MSENRKLVELANNSMKAGDNGGDLQRIKNELLNFYNSVSKNLILKNIGDSFSQFVGPTTELAKSQDKLVEINIAESNIYINPERYKSFFAGLLHVFRNAVDHGIESREERKEMGKNTTASIDVSFKEVGISRFKILIKDDGKGINADKIRDKIKDAKGLDDEGLKDEEVIQFIFESGLSTREEASEISGRGVGMDVVKKEIEKMDGSVFVESAVNEGTLFLIELPILK